jgi:hypothetical protein
VSRPALGRCAGFDLVEDEDASLAHRC